jgi:predicted branched-subunit amino acid permease
VVRRYSQPDPSPHKHWFYLGSALFMYVNWQICTWIGIWAGKSIPNPLTWGLDFALPVTFIGMLVPSLRGRSAMASAGAAAVAILAFRHLPGQLGLILSVILAVVAGSLTELLQVRSTPRSGRTAK